MSAITGKAQSSSGESNSSKELTPKQRNLVLRVNGTMAQSPQETALAGRSPRRSPRQTSLQLDASERETLQELHKSSQEIDDFQLEAHPEGVERERREAIKKMASHYLNNPEQEESSPPSGRRGTKAPSEIKKTLEGK